MSKQSVQTVLFSTFFANPRVVQFDTPQQSSDGGAILLKEINDRLGLTARLAACLNEWRQVGKVEHDLPMPARRRCLGLACGYPDANDGARLKDDQVHRLLVGGDPTTGSPLASQATLSRFENAVITHDVVRLTSALADVVIAHHQARFGSPQVRRITIGLNPTDNPTYGQQQLAFVNSRHDT